jgi:hypothetical protein
MRLRIELPGAEESCETLTGLNLVKIGFHLGQYAQSDAIGLNGRSDGKPRGNTTATEADGNVEIEDFAAGR